MLVSWGDLLDRMAIGASGEPGIVEDIRQLQGLAQREDSETFLPLHSEELSSEFGRRINHFYNLFVNATDRLVEEGAIDWMGIVSSSWTSCGRRIQFSGTDAWFGIHYQLWARGASEDTPLWLHTYGASPDILNIISAELELRVSEENYFPIHLKTGVEYDDVLGDVVRQLKAIADIIKANTPPAQPD